MITKQLIIWAILLFFAVDIFVVIYVLVRKRRKSINFKDQNYIKLHWYKILDFFNSNPSKAIMDADKILDFTLAKHGKTGNLGEKLKQSEMLFSDYNGVWRAHKLRNRIAHELGEVNSREAKSALNNFKRALKDLGADI